MELETYLRWFYSRVLSLRKAMTLGGVFGGCLFKSVLNNQVNIKPQLVTQTLEVTSIISSIDFNVPL
jgi:hypothetical protein